MVSLWCSETVKGKHHSSGGPDRVAAASAESAGRHCHVNRKGTSKNSQPLSEATELPSNDSGSFSLRFGYVPAIPVVNGNGPKRFSVQRKMAIVARLLRGEPLDLVARQTNVSIARLTEWRDRALVGAATALKERERDDRDDEIARLKSKVGEITMDNELLNAKIAALEGKRPLAHRRSRR